MMIGKVSCIPSSSFGRAVVQKGWADENQTALGRVQWKNRWLSFSREPQREQFLSILSEYLAARSPVANARRISLQAKVLMFGGIDLIFQVLLRMDIACWEMLLDPCCGNWTCV
jgi:hypothetical protein